MNDDCTNLADFLVALYESCELLLVDGGLVYLVCDSVRHRLMECSRVVHIDGTLRIRVEVLQVSDARVSGSRECSVRLPVCQVYLVRFFDENLWLH